MIKQIRNLSTSLRKNTSHLGYSSKNITAISLGFPAPVKNNIIDLLENRL